MNPQRYTKRLLKQAAQTIGLDVRRYRHESTEASRLLATLRHFDIELVADIGANTGLFGALIRNEGYDRRIVSFEPLPDAYVELKRAAADDSKWLVHERCAIGSQAGSIKINVAGNSQSSSILPMLAAHSEAAPDSRYIRTEECNVVRLDDVLPAYAPNYRTTFLKIDTQGFEWEVLQGAPVILESVRAVQLELSLVPLYDGQASWETLAGMMKALGFDVWAFWPVFHDERTGQTLQVDAIFIRR
jgi:FkbM family methyltransferase